MLVCLLMSLGTAQGILVYENREHETFQNDPLSASEEPKSALDTFFAKVMNSDNAALEQLLEELEPIVEDSRWALDFARSPFGLQKMKSLLQHGWESIRRNASLVFGSAFQNNEQVQQKALDFGYLDALLEAIAVERNEVVLNRLLYALSSLVRSNALGVQQFYDKQGPSHLLRLFDVDRSEELNKKIAVLMSDVLNKDMLPEGTVIHPDKTQLANWCTPIEKAIASNSVSRQSYEDFSTLLHAMVPCVSP